MRRTLLILDYTDSTIELDINSSLSVWPCPCSDIKVFAFPVVSTNDNYHVQGIFSVKSLAVIAL